MGFGVDPVSLGDAPAGAIGFSGNKIFQRKKIKNSTFSDRMGAGLKLQGMRN